MNKKHITPFFHSLAFKIYCTAALCILSLLLANWLLNHFAFSGYYRSEKHSSLTQTFAQLSDSSQNRERLSQYLEQQEAQTDTTFLLWNDYQILYRSSSLPLSGSGMGGFLLMPPLDMEPGTYLITDRPFREQTASADTLTLYGKTENGINVMLQTSLTDVDKSTAIANRFLLWSALVTIVVGGIAVWLLARSFTKPVSQLSSMAQKMATLDFHDRYHGTGRDELAALGTSLNTVSEVMETTLSELKTANARLLGDVEKSERQDEARRSFISNVSHELKTPIALIQTYAEGLRENVAEDTQQREFYCEVISDEAQRLSQMISRMTMLMQLESGKAELQIDRFDIRHLCERLLERHAPLLEERGISMPVLPVQPFFVWGDALLIDNVMTNYLTNALHYVEENGTIHIGWEPTGNQTLRITVYNSGSHIPESDLSRVWESFYKVDKARTHSYGGTGIGLSVVAAIMRVHRMPYGVCNREDGVEFYIELPIT